MRFFIAQIGRTVGINGDLKLHIHSDFPEQFQANNTFESDIGTLQINRFDPKRSTVSFVGYATLEDAKRLTNVKLYADDAQTKKNCMLQEGEYFWFDVIGCQIVESGETLGRVISIERLVDTDFMSVETASNLVEKGSAKSFLIPYIPRYIQSVNIDKKEIVTHDAKEILEAS
ncbi:MAG: 16S rRNA processing protein RimM [Campylobacterales bacterium]|nr:16S rRNA processing protein RimM [Campylobacterales bacterium]